MTDAARNGAEPQQPQVKMQILGQFIKDMSFENVAAQKGLQGQVDPDIQVQVNLDARKRGDNQYDVTTKLTVDSKNKDDSIFLSRAQANEWKGWMQVAFVAYHYTNAQDVYVPVRWFVSAYVWLSGFGNGVYFWSSADFSFKRFAQQLWRINFLCA
ncbi:MAG: protein-export chaperone SecB, partial [Pseudomonadota bacterium]